MLKFANNKGVEKYREGMSTLKLNNFYNLLIKGDLPKVDMFVERFQDFNIDIFRDQTAKDIENVLLDVDGCIASAYLDISWENIYRVQKLIEKGVKVGVYSNCKYMERLEPIKDMGVPIYDGEFAKPDPRGFLDAAERFGFEPEKTIMIGDNPLTDGGASNVLGGFVLVSPIKEKFFRVPMKKVPGLFFQKFFRGLILRKYKKQ